MSEVTNARRIGEMAKIKPVRIKGNRFMGKEYGFLGIGAQLSTITKKRTEVLNFSPFYFLNVT